MVVHGIHLENHGQITLKEKRLATFNKGVVLF